ncbi:hypothetical protein [Polaribacter sp. Hel1_85]|uniref:hypothetical protein n=1 Tax=Polaribacter sp. Hel1_85 TaxID=1250005 RepID=UPI00052D78C2|nr:hypothetical protein [Polaribacter sp. Hel1_85]KGL59032.1 hypothetical protein PHEL85_3306 [Polaribacter sp. Hel1_85]
MKGTLEYKILKHLSENNNGKLIDISEIEENKEQLKSVIKDLKEREFIETEPYPPNVKINDGWVSAGDSEKPEKCKIKFLGIEYLDNLERSIIELNLAESNIKANNLNKNIAKKNEKNEKFNKFSTISNIIIGLLNVGLLIWQILKSE